ncbi:hypothetical protein NXH64_07440 [Butyrivibrio fibrisolvens]|uniref:hypothetical protein n=1 Tax=Pseudobutyrivibrio ruminis TaxID=46206 RepID=UPI0004035D70|nr:hypothetical protein [Pseudobutyrivibrio ruminis]MDC7279335.1 hypothetical protein [Butyrivibrio fibrisolvens]
MFLNRYEIHERGDKVSFRDSRVAWVYILIFLLFGGLTILFAILSGVGHYDDFSATVLIIFFGVIITCLFVSCCEVKFVVTPEYISAKYGLIGRKFKFNNVDICYVNSERYITLMDEKGRELTLNLQHLPEEAGDYVTRAARENQVKVRSIGLFESNENTTNNSYNFKLVQKAYVLGIVMFIGFILAIDIPLTEVLIEGVEDQGTFILVLVIMIANTAFWLFFILRYTQFIYINGQEIEIRGLIRKPRVFNVKDISYVYTHENKYNTKAGSYQVEEMDIYVDGELVKIPSRIGRGYKKYDMFVAFLQDNGVPFSLTKDEKITYKEVEEKSQQEIPELLNLDEHAFTCDDNYIIENGIFQGMKLEEEPEEEIDYSDYHKGIKRFLVFAKLFHVLGQISLIIAMIALKADLLSFLQAIIIPGSCYLLLFIFATLCDLYCYSVITKDASCYPATVFSAYQIEDDLTVFYAYNAGSTVRVAEPYEANKKLDYYLKRYGEPTYIWSNFEKAPVFIEGDVDGPKGKGKYVGKLILLITILFLLLAVFFG